MIGEEQGMTGDATISLFGDIVVLDLTSTIRGMHCTKMFGDYGAEVILVEPPGGSLARQVGPFAHGKEDPEASLHFAHHNRNKKSVTLNLQTQRGQELLRELARSADLLVADRPPTMTGGQQAEHATAMHAAYAAAAALLYRDLHGVGQHIDVAAQECVANVLENAIEQYTYTGVVRNRSGRRHGPAWPCTVFKCKDGYIGICCTQVKEVRAAVLLAEDMELADDPVLQSQSERRARADELEPRLIAGYMQHGKKDLFHEGQSLGCPIGMTSDAYDLATDEHLNEIGFFAEFEHPVIGKYKDIAAPVYFTETPGVMRSSAPLLGQHTAEVLGRLGIDDAGFSHLHADGVI